MSNEITITLTKDEANELRKSVGHSLQVYMNQWESFGNERSQAKGKIMMAIRTKLEDGTLQIGGDR